MKRKVASLLSFCILLTCLFGASGTASARASEYITSYDAAIVANSDKTVSVDFDIAATGYMTTLGVSSIKIQKYDSGSWTTVQTLTTSNTTGLQKSNAASYSKTVTSSSLSSGTYRAYVTFYAANSSGSDSKTYTTGSVAIS